MRLQGIQGLETRASLSTCVVNTVSLHANSWGFSVRWAETLVLGDCVTRLFNRGIQISRNSPLPLLWDIVIAVFGLWLGDRGRGRRDDGRPMSHRVLFKKSVIQGVPSDACPQKNFLWFLYLLCAFSTFPWSAGVLFRARLYLLPCCRIFKRSAHKQPERPRTTRPPLMMDHNLFQRIMQSVRISSLMMNHGFSFWVLRKAQSSRQGLNLLRELLILGFLGLQLLLEQTDPLVQTFPLLHPRHVARRNLSLIWIGFPGIRGVLRFLNQRGLLGVWEGGIHCFWLDRVLSELRVDPFLLVRGVVD